MNLIRIRAANLAKAGTIMSLREEGFRMLVQVSGNELRVHWTHPAEVPQMIACGWQDATDMGDEEYDAAVANWIGDES